MPANSRNSDPERAIELLVHALSPRQREVLALIGNGSTNAEIGKQLGISERTVESHRRRVRKVLGIKSTADLYRIALAWAKFWKPD
ncbi:MAG TPA: helix-turn-helix transcriptional regulator [Gemmatimonadales bacterium]|jgi:DNA-binding CsgD family transcriptional regulator|nr:helix-turn-helix transcriptional regulator [Gemmatimonadales bacterium]